MTERFCPGCQTDVEDTGGFCLLGHRLALDAPVASLTELRDDEDRSYAQAQLDEDLPDASLPAEVDVPQPVLAGAARTRASMPPPPPPPPVVVPPPVDVTSGQAHEDRSLAPAPPQPPATPPSMPPLTSPVAPAPAARRAPPPPPPPVAPRRQVFAGLEHQAEVKGDPISAFAPAPRMDWGPDKGGLKRLRRAKRASNRRAPEPQPAE